MLDHNVWPSQLGVEIPGGFEAVVHAYRKFMLKMLKDFIVVKLDFSSAFIFFAQELNT